MVYYLLSHILDFLDQLFNAIKEYLSIIISSLALLISFLSYRLNKEKIDVEFSNEPFWIKSLDVYYQLLDDSMSFSNLPRKNYGYFKPKDTQSIDIVISPEPDVTSVTVKFKIATKSLNPFRKINRQPSNRYKTYSQKYVLAKYEKPDYNLLNEDLRNVKHQHSL